MEFFARHGFRDSPLYRNDGFGHDDSLSRHVAANELGDLQQVLRSGRHRWGRPTAMKTTSQIIASGRSVENDIVALLIALDERLQARLVDGNVVLFEPLDFLFIDVGAANGIASLSETGAYESPTSGAITEMFTS